VASSPNEAPAGLVQEGTVIDRYKVLRLLAEGGMGAVYLARDTALGRRVALKLLRGDAPGDAGAVDRFLDEARITARINHPHVVTVYGAGLHWGNPFVALEYLEGQTLRERLTEQRIGALEAARIGVAVAEALAEAHRQGVLHRDLKPENVMIPADGRVRVVDFGLAELRVEPRASEDAAGAAAAGAADVLQGTLTAMAPELWCEQPATPATDVWSLGLILAEALLGRHPLEGLDEEETIARVTGDEPLVVLDDDVPEPMGELVLRCIERQPGARPDAKEAVRVLRQLLDGSAPAPDRSPFRGLLPWDEQDAAWFAGRETEIAAVVERLRLQPVLPIVGASGAGKSSLVQAGVLPRLRERGDLCVIAVRPGRQPLRALARRIDDQVGPLQEINEDGTNDRAAALMETPQRLALWLAGLAERRGVRVVLLVDQLEELVTLTEDAAERRAFLDAVCGAADDVALGVRVLLVLRDDYLGSLALGRPARDALGHAMVLGRPGGRALREILERPVRAAGYRYADEEMVGQMVEAVRSEPAALPLLQVVGEEIWDRRDRAGKVLPREAYEEVGGIDGALAHHADGVLTGLPAGRVSVARALLMRLLAGGQTGEPMHRRAVARSELLAGLETHAAEVLDHLVRGRLVVARRSLADGLADGPDGGDDEGELELVHESLIHRWDRLVRWIDASREDLGLLTDLGQAAEVWDRRGRRDEELWRGAPLDEALARAKRLDDVPARAAAFLAAGGELQRRTVRLRRGLVVGSFAVLAAVAVALGLQARVASQQREAAEQERTRAEQRQAEVQREGARAALADGEVLQAHARLRESLELDDSPVARALWWQLRRHPMRWHLDLPSRVLALDASPDGSQLAVGCVDRRVLIVDVASRAVSEVTQLDDKVTAVAFAPTGKELASRELAIGSLDGTVSVVPLDGGEARVRYRHDAPVHGVALSRDGQLLASADTAGSVRVYELTTGSLRRTWTGHSARVTEVAFAPDAAALATESKDGRVILWDLASGEPRGTLDGHTAGEFQGGLAWSPDGKLMADAGPEHAVRIVDASTLEVLHTMPGHTAAVTAVAFSPDGTRLASAGQDGTVRVWDVKKGQSERVLRGHDNWVNDVVFADGGRALASGGRDQVVRLWNLTAPPPADKPRGHTADTLAIAFGPGGDTLASGSNDQTVRLWDLASGRTTAVISVEAAEVQGVAHSPDGGTLAVAGGDGAVRLVDLASAAVLHTMPGRGPSVIAMSYAADGGVLEVLDGEGSITAWDTRSGERRVVRAGGAPVSLQGRFHPDGEQVVAAGHDGRIRVWDVRSGTLTAELEGHDGRVVDAALHPGGQLVISGGADGTVRLWDRRTGDHEVLAELGSVVYSVSVDPAGQRAAVACADGSVSIFDELEAGSRRPLFRHTAAVNAVRFSLDGRSLATSAEDGVVELWDVETGAPRWRSRDASADPRQLPAVDDIVTRDGLRAAAGVDGSVTLHHDPTGALLLSMDLYGPASHLRIDGHGLVAATTMADGLAWDLGVFRVGYCDLMAQVWTEVPVRWIDDRPVATPAPADHRCAGPP